MPRKKVTRTHFLDLEYSTQIVRLQDLDVAASTSYFYPIFVHLPCYPLIATSILLRRSFGRLSKASVLCDRIQDSGPVIKALNSLLTVYS